MEAALEKPAWEGKMYLLLHNKNLCLRWPHHQTPDRTTAGVQRRSDVIQLGKEDFFAITEVCERLSLLVVLRLL